MRKLQTIKGLSTNQNIKGSFKINRKRYFFKILPKDEFELEVAGYFFAKNYYPVPVLITQNVINNNQGIVLYQYEQSIGANKGLVIDLVAGKKNLLLLNPIWELYLRVFKNNIIIRKPDSSFHALYTKRMRTRIEFFYDNDFKERNSGTYIFNDKSFQLDLKDIIKRMQKFYMTDKRRWCIPTQGDPNDLNIGLKPIWFDFTYAGWHPVLAEISTFLWYFLARGGHLALIYNALAYKDHKKVYRYADFLAVDAKQKRIKHVLKPRRFHVVEDYLIKVIKPTLALIKLDKEWYEELLMYLTIRVLGTVNPLLMKDKDRIFMLGYLAFFNALKPKNIEDFFGELNNIYGRH